MRKYRGGCLGLSRFTNGVCAQEEGRYSYTSSWRGSRVGCSFGSSPRPLRGGGFRRRGPEHRSHELEAGSFIRPVATPRGARCTPIWARTQILKRPLEKNGSPFWGYLRPHPPRSGVPLILGGFLPGVKRSLAGRTAAAPTERRPSGSRSDRRSVPNTSLGCKISNQMNPPPKGPPGQITYPLWGTILAGPLFSKKST